MKRTVFYSSVYPLTKVLLIGLPIGLFSLVIFIFSEGSLKTGDLFAALLILGAAIFLLWLLLDTKYIIKNDSVLQYNSGPIRGKINIHCIRKIEYQHGWVSKSLLKAALDKNGLYIYYNTFDDLYVSPKNKEDFVNYLLTINPKIELI